MYFKRIPEKFVTASNLLFFVTFLKLLNVTILEIIPTGSISIKMVGILALFIVCAFVLRRGYKWMIYIMPLIMLFPWVLLQTNIVHIFKINPLAAIITGVQFFLQVVIMEALLSSQTAHSDRGLASKAVSQ